MKFLSFAHELSPVPLVGGKGHHLQKLMQWKAPVAPFVVITTQSFDYFVQHGELPQRCLEQVEAFVRKYKKVAMRSSMIGEDQLDASFAGLFETILGIDLSNWSEGLKKIYASLNSDRVKQYILQKQIHHQLKMAVVVQEEIQVEKSGVLFTRSPVWPTSTIAIDVGLGMGEGVVSGHVDVDHYLFSRLGDQLRGPEKGILNSEELRQLQAEAIRLEKEFDGPADIEWGIRGATLYIFQIRPITQNFRPLKIFADTNLSESYPGSVSPFTATFVKKAYENVFTESAILLGAKGDRLETLKSHYAHLISHVGDHLYYDLEHYYAVLRSLPGGEKNIHNWHKMIGGQVEGAEVPYHATSLSALETIQSLLSLWDFALKKDQSYAQFLSDLDMRSSKMEAEIYRLNSSSAIISYLTELMQRPLGFGITVANDVYIMIGLGILSKRLKVRGLSEDLVIDLLRTENGIDSVKPLEAFESLLGQLSPEFISSFESLQLKKGFDPYTKALQELSAKWPQEVRAIRNFLEEYGDRSFEELKIESLPLKNDPQLFKTMIKWGKQKSASVQGHSSEKVSVPLNAIERKVLNFTRDCITFREASRLWRGRYYHFIRELMIRLAQTLHQEDSKWTHFELEDFFSLDYQEWQAYSDKKLSFEQVQKLMQERTTWKNKRQSYPEFMVWSSGEKPLFPNTKQEFSHQGLKGQGVSAGIVEARALVLENPVDAMESDLDDFILVTKNTDPAWVYIMSRSKGLVSEKGSLLSHTAIIGRELGIPTLVGVKAATQVLKTGDRLRIDGTTGEVMIL